MGKKNLVLSLLLLGGALLFDGAVFASSQGPRGDTTMESKGSYRKQLLLEYRSLATGTSEAPLRELREGDDAAALAKGKHKTALVLHALRRLAGEEAFSRLSGADRATLSSRSWDELRARSEKELGRDLGWFFRQWVDGQGLPDLRAENASVRRYGSRFELSFDLVQKGGTYTLDIPVAISFFGKAVKREVLRLDVEKKHIALVVDEEPKRVVIDPEYDVPRKLTDAEVPPLLATLLSEGKPLVVTAATGTGIYGGAIEGWKRQGLEARQPGTIKDGELKSTSLLVFGADNPVVERLYGEVEPGQGSLTLRAKKNPWNSGKVVVIVEARTAQAAADAVAAVADHGMCSSLSIDGKGQATQKTEESEEGIALELREETGAIDLSALTTLSRVIEGLSWKKIVYVGEYHDRFAHHNVQLQIIRGLHRKDPKLAVGMEMFQRPFQKTLDEYVSGSIDEREFLVRAEYFKRWNFDYNLYKPLLDFARAEKIPVVALNLRKEITDKVSKTGMDSLSEEERKDVPAQMDFSDTEYRDRLLQVFSQHRGSADRNFDFFYQAQLLWDEGMARSIDDYLRKNPDQRMVVLAGQGHLLYGSGIPKRTFRRNHADYATVLSDSEVEPGIADYVLFPQALDGLTAPKIMANLREDGARVSIAGLPDGSVSKKAGIQVGDVVVSLDNVPVRSVDDIKIALLYKKPDDTVRIKVVRNRFLLGDTEREFLVTLQ